MSKKNLSKSVLMVALITGNVIWGGTAVHAEEPNQAFTLDPMIVTAQRTETRDLDTPATTNIITEQNIKEAGYKNVFDAIEHQVGLTSTGYGDAGQDFGFSSGRTVIRGYDRGTLIMVDGIPMNLKNYNSLDGIPIDMVQQIEIIKGAAGTLYGSEAMGGVVNIITKKPGGKTQVKVKGTVGNYYKDYGVTYAGEKLIVTASKEYSNKLTHSNAYPEGSSTDWWVGKGQKNRAGISAALTDEIGFTFIYQDGNITRGSNNDAKKVGSVYKKYNYRYDDKRITTGLTYDGKSNGIKAIVGYNYRRTEGYDFTAATPGPVSSSADLSSYIGDVQKTWKLGKNTLITGYSLRRENYENLVTKANKAHRTSNAIYLSYNNVFSDKFSATLGLRGEIIDDPVKSENILNPQFQTLYKINDNTSWYINIGKAFQMPTVDSYYGKKAAAGTLKPEEGWTYETGIKKIYDNKSIKLAVFHMDFENKIGWSDKDPGTGEQYAINKGDFRNTGIEAEFTHNVNDKWRYSLGIGYGNPEVKDPSAANPKWVQDDGRIDVSASVFYSISKLTSGLTYKYLGDREYYGGHDVPSRSRLTWNTSYDLTKNDNITLTMNNLLDKDNYSNRYGNLDLPYNWKITYTRTF